MFFLGWEPSRTLLFCSFGLEDVENYSLESWINRHINIVKQRTVAYVNVAEAVQGFDYLNIKINPFLKNLLSNTSALVINPNENNRFAHNETLLDVQQQKPNYLNENYDEHLIKENRNNSKKLQNREMNLKSKSEIIELFESSGIPTVSFSYGSQVDDKNKSSVNISQYERSIHQLWTLLIFSLADNVIIPFNVTSYVFVLENLNTEIEERISLKNTTLASDFYKFSIAVRNLIPIVQKFQMNIVHFSRKENFMKRRFLNDKLMLLGKLFACGKRTIDLLLTKFNDEVSNHLKTLKTSLKRGTNCMEEIHSAVQNIYD